MERVMVIGCPGAGKTTFARRLRDVSGLPLYHLDRLWHRPDRTTVPRAEFDARLREIVRQERWIIDGDYQRTLELRLAACGTVFLMDLPAGECLAGAAARIGREREDLPWVETELDEAFRRRIADFSKERLPRIHALLEHYREGREIVVFRSRQEADRYLERWATVQTRHGDKEAARWHSTW